jgi:hypothetical protein
VDQKIDFDFGDSFITATGKDYISARWSGFIQVPFNETFTFYAQANDGAKLFVNDQLVIDHFDAMVNETTTGVVSAQGTDSEYLEFVGTTSAPLMAGRLYSITLEYRENTGNARLRLLWSSASQKKDVVPSTRLFHATTPVVNSPFTIAPVGIIPTTTVGETVTIDTSTSLQIAFDTPVNTGGEPVTKYKIEWYSTWGATPVQTIAIKGATGGWFTVRYDAESTVPLPYDIVPWKLEFELERLASIRDVSVSFDNTTADAALWSVTFLAYPGALPHDLIVESTDLKGVGVDTATCQTPGSATSTPSGITCPTNAATAQDGTAPAKYGFSENSFESFGVNVHDKHKWIIPGLDSGQVYNVRVSAFNSRGYSVPSTPVSEAPRAVPDAPAMATLLLVASSSTSLKTYWTIPPNHQGAPTTQYRVEWDTDPLFNSTALKSYEDSVGNFDSHLLAPDNY